MTNRRNTIFGALVLLAAMARHGAATPPAPPAVVDWIRTHAAPFSTPEAGHGFDDLRAFGDMVGDARIVGLGETTHGTREIFQMKHRLLEYLVVEHGFTVFGLEASLPDCVAINDYVLHGRGDAETALHGQGFWTWDTEEVLDMIRWMRAYNDDPAHDRKIRFSGYDMQSLPPALSVALDYVRAIDAARADILAADLDALRTADARTIANVPPEGRRAMRDAADGLVATYDEHRDEWIAATSADAFDLARWHAVIVGQYAEMLDSSVVGHQGAIATMQRVGMAFGPAGLTIRTYLDHVDFARVDAFEPLLAAAAGDLDAFLIGYQSRLDHDARQAYRDRADALVTLLAEHRDEYVGRWSEEAWTAAAQAAATMRAFFEAADAFVGMGALDAMPNVRDRCMAENIAWILDREGPDARMVVWAHNGHIMARPSAPGTGPMGDTLRRTFGADYVPVGFLFDRGGFQAIWRPGPDEAWDGAPALRPFTVGASAPGTHDAAFAATGLARCIVDLRTVPREGAVNDWFRTPRSMRTIGAIFSPAAERNFATPVELANWFDLAIFFAETTPARPARLTREQFGMPPRRDG
ncbi:MAG: erythromycin esterase family protein [Phycisphaerales bacterium]|nr:erythromycin esterase family protein [Phycisphaerales bacterium]